MIPFQILSVIPFQIFHSDSFSDSPSDSFLDSLSSVSDLLKSATAFIILFLQERWKMRVDTERRKAYSSYLIMPENFKSFFPNKSRDFSKELSISAALIAAGLLESAI